MDSFTSSFSRVKHTSSQDLNSLSLKEKKQDIALIGAIALAAILAVAIPLAASPGFRAFLSHKAVLIPSTIIFSLALLGFIPIIFSILFRDNKRDDFSWDQIEGSEKAQLPLAPNPPLLLAPASQKTTALTPPPLPPIAQPTLPTPPAALPSPVAPAPQPPAAPFAQPAAQETSVVAASAPQENQGVHRQNTEDLLELFAPTGSPPSHFRPAAPNTTLRLSRSMEDLLS